MRTPRITSPFNLMQERFRDDPWALLVGTILFSMVKGSRAQLVHEKFLERWPTPERLIDESHGIDTISEMKTLFEPLGLQMRRSVNVLNMTLDFLELRPHVPGVGGLEVDIRFLYGCGKYSADSFDMFYRGYLIEDVEDKELKKYVEWAKSLPEGTGEGVREITLPSGPPGTNH